MFRLVRLFQWYLLSVIYHYDHLWLLDYDCFYKDLFLIVQLIILLIFPLNWIHRDCPHPNIQGKYDQILEHQHQLIQLYQTHHDTMQVQIYDMKFLSLIF